MSTEKAMQLNNEVIIPANRVREYPTNSLVKNNNIGEITITNPDFLTARTEKDAYVFATIDGISGSINSEWAKANSSSVIKSFSGTNSDETASGVLNVSIPQGKSQIRLTGNVSLLVHAGLTDEQSTQIEINKTIFYSGDTKTFAHTFQIISGTSNAYANLYCKLTFSNNQISAVVFGGSGRYYKKWKITVTLTSVEYVTAEGITGTIVGSSGQKFAVGSSLVTLSEDTEIFIVPQTYGESVKTTNKLYATCSYTKRDGSKGETDDGYLTTVNEAYVALKPYLYDNYESFVDDCKRNIPNTVSPSILYVGLNKQIYKSWYKTESLSSGVFRFDKTFPIYTCVMQAQTDTIFNENVSLKLWKRPTADSTAYTKKEFAYKFSQQKGNAHTIQANSLWQEATRYGDENKTLESIISTDVFEKFKNGRRAAKVSIFCDKYLDFKGEVVYDGTNGYFPKVDDIVMPYTIRNMVGGETVLEVPLLSNGYETDANGQQRAIGKQFYVTSCNLDYDGDFEITLEMLEKTSSSL